ncbi:citrate lyase beta subunit [Aspergillus rambellii]|uniref:Citrate lyase beta subunit n=1 Tax=Aspergillus rambellii TaxID=308745 RepID=A0A0F8VSK9_9EURO|nr:citrate lyase beta subunit [Aspergillus rambellii]
MASRNALRRALLYIPGSSQRFIDKSRTLSVDCVAYDLEDSVAPHMKAEARSLVRRALDQPVPAGIRERAVRINSVNSGLALSDLTEVLKSPNLTTIVIPKVNSASDLTFVTDVINHTLSQSQAPPQSQAEADALASRPPISLLALVESAKSLTNLTHICSATPLLQGLIFAAEDFALDLSLTRTPALTEFLFARSAIVTAARAADLPSTIDLVCTTYKSTKADGSPPAVLEEECRGGRGLGFNGKQCIHPSQVETVQAIYGPDPEEVQWAVRTAIADEKAARAGRGAWTLDGKMIDVPVAAKARAIVKRAEACGFNVGELREKWKGQEPA